MEQTERKEQEGEIPKWYDGFGKCVAKTEGKKSTEQSCELKIRGEKALNGETAAFDLKQSRTRGSDYTWLKTALSRGTASDKVAACIVLIQESPKHNLSRINWLVSKVKLSKSDHCVHTMHALKELFLNDLLHPEIKLVRFEDQDFDRLQQSEKNNENRLLADWYFEDQLKLGYDNFVDAICEIAVSGAETLREKSVGIICELLIGNPEQEQKLLTSLVNKVGDPCAKVCSKAVFCLQKLLNEHPNMKGVVLNELEKLLFRSNVAPRVQYYAICLLTQFVLDKEDGDIATALVDLYFAFFKACLKKGEPKSKMMAAILSGVNRAYHYAKIDTEKIKQHVDALFKVVHVGTFNVSLMALNLLFQVCSKNRSMSDRFYTAFYKKLLDPEIGNATKRAVLLNLFLRAVRQDASVVRAAAFIKRILQSALYFPPNMICAVLLVVSQIVKTRRDLRQIFHKPSVRSTNIETAETSPKKKNKKQKERAESTSEDIILSNVTAVPTDVDVKTQTDIDIKKEEDKMKQYDRFCRNPLHAGGYNALYEEINALINHFHPSVALFAKNIMKGETINYTGDPLKDLTAIRFLDRYVFKNPKKLSEVERKKKSDPLAKGQVYDPQGMKKMSVENESYLNMDEKKIPVDELFLYKFLRMRKASKPERDEESDDNESVNSEEFNEMLDRMGGNVDDDLDDLDDLDVAADYVQGSKKKAKLPKEDDEDAPDMEDVDDEEDFEDANDSDDENDSVDEDFDDDESLNLDEIDDDDASDIDFDEEEVPKKKGKLSTEDVFMSAEKFAEMLEEEGLSEFKSGASNTLSDADGSNHKQLKWEMKRNHKMAAGKGYASKRKGPKHAGKNKKRK